MHDRASPALQRDGRWVVRSSQGLQNRWKAVAVLGRELREHSYLILLLPGVLPGNSLGVQIERGAAARARWPLPVGVCLSPLPSQPPGQDANVPGARDPAHPAGEPGGSGQDPHARENSKQPIEPACQGPAPEMSSCLNPVLMALVLASPNALLSREDQKIQRLF